MSINERIKQVRKSKNLTIEQFGEKLGLLKTAISKIENGKQNVTDQTIKLICREFNINENWLRNGDGDMLEPSSRYNDISNLANKLMADEDNSFKTKFINLLANLSVNEWEYLEKKAFELLDDIDRTDVINSLDKNAKAQVMNVLGKKDTDLIDQKVADYRLYHTDSYVAEASPEEEYDTIEVAEAAYNKSRLNSVQKTTLSASNITTATGTDGNGK